MATPFFSDDFNAADGVLLETYSNSWVRSTSTPNGAIDVFGSAARQQNVNTSVYANSNSLAPSPDYDVSATLVVVSGGGTPSVGICGRMAGTGGAPVTFYQVRLVNNSTGLVLARFVNGATATLLSMPLNYAAGSNPKITLRMQGDQISALLDDVLVLGPVTDNSITAAGYTGLRMASANTSQIRVDSLRSAPIELAQPVTVTAAWSEQGETSAILATVAVNAFVSWLEQSETSALSVAIAAPTPGVNSSINWTEKSETGNTFVSVRVNLSASWLEQSENTSLTVFAISPLGIAVGWSEQSETSFLAISVEGQGQDFIDALLVPMSRTVVFEGSKRVVSFEGSKRVVSFEGSIRTVRFE